jgi:energy-coupling factor transport system ATP-binding protein
MLIRISGLDHTYMEGTPFEQKVLHGVSLEIGQGEVVGIIGPAQSGKSTLIQYFNGLYVPRRTGQVIVDGIDTAAKGVAMKTLRQKVGLVFQYAEHQLFRDVVGKDMAFGPECLKLPPDEVQSRVIAALQAVGLDPDIFYKRYVFALSGGQKRRVAIAGVLALNPKVMVFDDPTAGLDPRGRREILDTIVRLHDEQGLTVVFVSNNFDDVYRVVDRIVVLNSGRVIASGTPEAILSDVALLQQVDLGIMQTVEVLHQLRARGWDVNLSALGVEDAALEIARSVHLRGR